MKRFSKSSAPLEKQIQDSICEYLATKKHFFYRQNNIPAFDRNTGKRWNMPKWGKNGAPDIVVVLKGKYLGLEVKRPTTGQNEAQKVFEKELTEAGGEYYVVRSIEDVQKLGL